jgi:hypothetical protein
MARKRYLKPGFFKNEELAGMLFEYRILFQGLWCYADREGRLEDRPMRLKSDIFPYDNIDFNAGLDLLQEKGFIVRYATTVKGKTFNAIQIVNFTEHQDVHINEQASIIPAQAPYLHGASTVQIPHENGGSTPFTCNSLTFNSKPLLDPLIDVDDEAREIKILEAIEDFTTHKQPQEEKEKKVAAKKEKYLPVIDEMIERIEQSGTCHWWNAIEFYIAKGVNWHKISDKEKQTHYDRRKELFKKFYASKADNYLIRLPSCNEISQNFYNWIPSEMNREKLQQLNSVVIAKSSTLGNSKTQSAHLRHDSFTNQFKPNEQRDN